MTKAASGFIIAGLFVYLLASQTQIGWLYLFDAVIWSVLVLSAVLPWYSLKSLQLERRVLLRNSDLCQAQLGGPLEDETVEVELKMTNNGHMARYFIKVLDDCPFEQPEKQHKALLVTNLNPQSKAVFSYAATCYRRGHHTSSSATLQSSGPLGLIVRRRTFELPLNLTVYPAYYQMEGLPATDAAWPDWGHASKSGTAAEFYGSREYQYGDPLKHIHWRNTARLGHFMVKEFEQSSQGPVTVAFETRRNWGTGREATLEYSVKIAASLAKLCADSGRSMDIIAGETPLYNAGWREAMDYLAHLEVGGEDGLAESVVILESHKAIVVIVPATETELVPALSQLAGQVRGLVVILLEGFAPDEVSNEFLSRLKGRNLDIISCSQGNLEATIKKLGNSLFVAGKLPTLIG
ncbi:DUF58 domain-containing protein [Chloroflexota bacterium]